MNILSKVGSYTIVLTLVTILGWHGYRYAVTIDENAELKRELADLKQRHQKLIDEFTEQHIDLMHRKGVEIHTPVAGVMKIGHD